MLRFENGAVWINPKIARLRRLQWCVIGVLTVISANLVHSTDLAAIGGACWMWGMVCGWLGSWAIKHGRASNSEV